MVKIRLTRFGRHKLPFYRVVAVDSRQKRDGAYIELLGTFEPFAGKAELRDDAIINWLLKGAKPSDTVRTLLKEHGTYAKYLATRAETKATRATPTSA